MQARAPAQQARVERFQLNVMPSRRSLQKRAAPCRVVILVTSDEEHPATDCVPAEKRVQSWIPESSFLFPTGPRHVPPSHAIALLFTLFLIAGSAASEPLPGTPPPPKLPVIDATTMSDPKKAAALADALEKEFPAAKRPEAVKMLITILRGDLMNGPGGWFGPAESRFDWKWLAEQHGIDPAKGAITKEKFRGSAALFARLDRDGDGRIVADDFDWSDKNPFVIQSGMVTRTFRRMNSRGDGKLTKKTWKVLRPRREREGPHHAGRPQGGAARLRQRRVSPRRCSDDGDARSRAVRRRTRLDPRRAKSGRNRTGLHH